MCVLTHTEKKKKKISDIISRPQVSLNDLINFVPRGTFIKNNISLEDEFASPLTTLLKPESTYKDLLSFGDFNSADKYLVESSDSYKNAVYVLKANTEYPLEMLEEKDLSEKISENYKKEILEDSEIAIKYKGYIEREQRIADKIMRLENLVIPDGFDFDRVESLSIECRQKLKRYAPRTIAQASRISGVSPADISVLLVYFGR